jgi:antitoxin StbD
MTFAKNLSMEKIMKQIVPISRFNRGEANKIFDELKETGVKSVLKNNIRVGVIVEPEQYDEMVELLEDYALTLEADRRTKNAETAGLLTEKQVMDGLKIQESDLGDVDLEID